MPRPRIKRDSVVIAVYADRSFTFILKSPPAAVLLKRQPALPKSSVYQTEIRSVQLPVNGF